MLCLVTGLRCDPPGSDLHPGRPDRSLRGSGAEKQMQTDTPRSAASRQRLISQIVRVRAPHPQPPTPTQATEPRDHQPDLQAVTQTVAKRPPVIRDRRSLTPIEEVNEGGLRAAPPPDTPPPRPKKSSHVPRAQTCFH